jgi:hypothetical protein
MGKKKQEEKQYTETPMCERCAIQKNKDAITEARSKRELWVAQIELSYHDDIMECSICHNPTCSYNKEEVVNNDKKS